MIDHMILDGANALIIGGDEGHRLSLRRSLCRGGMAVQEAATGAEGLDLARTQPDLIVVEVRLPDISGLDVTAALKADPLTQPIPVIQRSSAPIDDRAQVEVLTTGADAFLVEPIPEDMLIATAVALLRHSELSRQLELALSLDVTGVYDWNIATGDVRWSDSLERVHRLPPGGFGGTFEDFADHVHPEDRDRVRRELSEAAESADSIDMAFRFMRADRSFGWMESRGRVFRNRDGRAVRLLGLAHDVSSRMFERQRVDQLRRLASGLTSARTTSSVMETLGAELEGTNVSVQLITDDTPAEADVSFSYEVSGGRLDLTRAEGDEHSITERQCIAIGELAGGAVDRAMRYEAERSNAIALQRALLPTATPDIERWMLDAEYVPASTHDRLGGDFYDVVELDSSFVVFIGDVAGHGLSATHQMGACRTLLRTLVASHGGHPGEVLGAARALFHVVCGTDAPFVTALVARFPHAGGQVEIASAGHLAPLLGRSASTTLVDLRPGPPLGVGGAEAPDSTVVEIAIGDWMAFYTDGVFESRSVPIDESIRRVMAVLPDDVTAIDLIEAGESVVGLNPDDRAALVVRRLG